MADQNNTEDKKKQLDKAYEVFQKRLGVIRKIHERIKENITKNKKD